MNRLSIILAAILVFCTISHSALVPSKTEAVAPVAGASLSQKLISVPKPTIRTGGDTDENDDGTDDSDSDLTDSGDSQSDSPNSDSDDGDKSDDAPGTVRTSVKKAKKVVSSTVRHD